jgi:hypothetical protein
MSCSRKATRPRQKCSVEKADVGIILGSGCVVEILKEDFPACKSGLISVGDRLVSIQGKDVTAWSPEDAQLALCGNQVDSHIFGESALVDSLPDTLTLAGRSCRDQFRNKRRRQVLLPADTCKGSLDSFAGELFRTQLMQHPLFRVQGCTRNAVCICSIASQTAGVNKDFPRPLSQESCTSKRHLD